MEIDIEQDIVSVTDLKRRTKDVIDHARDSKRPTIVTVNGRADVVLMSAKTYEKMKRSANIAKTFQQSAKPAQQTTELDNTDPLSGQSFRKFKDFWQEFKYVHKIDA